MMGKHSCMLCQPPNKQMQRARTDHKCVLGDAHRRVADLRRYAPSRRQRAIKAGLSSCRLTVANSQAARDR